MSLCGPLPCISGAMIMSQSLPSRLRGEARVDRANCAAKAVSFCVFFGSALNYSAGEKGGADKVWVGPIANTCKACPSAQMVNCAISQIAALDPRLRMGTGRARRRAQATGASFATAPSIALWLASGLQLHM